MQPASRESILQKIKANKPEPVSLPETTTFETLYANAVEKFSEVLAGVGGKTIRVSNMEQVKEELLNLFGAVPNRATTIPALSGWADFSLNVPDPHLLETLQITVIEGHFGVAENAAIWVTEEQVSHRVLPFITQYLAVVIPEKSIVNNMHDAYRKIDPAARPGWGAFIAGPSKTADIEQSLVIGAHGPRGMTVFLMQEA